MIRERSFELYTIPRIIRDCLVQSNTFFLDFQFSRTHVAWKGWYENCFIIPFSA